MAKYVAGCKRGEEPKQAAIITDAQIKEFMLTADSSNYHVLVRMAASIVAISGGLRISDVRKLTQDSVTAITDGYRIVFDPCKGRANKPKKKKQT